MWGIPIELHITFVLLIAAVFVLSYPRFYPFFMVLSLFVFVVFHELAHSVVARHYGIRVRKIILYPIGGVSEIEELPERPSQEWRMAIAGPVISLLLGATLLGVNLLISPQAFIQSITSLAFAQNFLFDLGVLNLLLGFFNLIPAFPMDGGRVFRAVLAERMNYSDATRYAATIGKVFGIGMVIAGFLFPNYFLLILVGIFVYIGASEETEQTIISTTLASVRVKDVMQPEVGSVNPEQSLSESLEIMFKNRYNDVLVIKDGMLEGVISWDELMKVEPQQRTTLRIEQMPLRKVSIFEDESILEANKIMAKEKIRLIPVVDREAPTRVIGVLTSEAIAAAYEKARNR
ncbi:MAG: site-2 protease family protein [Candidatus Bathyarchaeota archaeon]|nr:site-2 protease family protein [Candidatus Bathyarchaeota archaeon]